MGIIKQAKNITVKVDSEYLLIVGGKLEKNANRINIEATKENLILNSNKKIIVQSGKK